MRSGTISSRSTRSAIELDAGTAEHRGEIADLDVDGPCRCRRDHEVGRQLHEAHAPVRQRERIDAQVGRPVEGERHAPVAQRRESPGPLRVERPPAALRQFEDDPPDRVGIGIDDAAERAQESRARRRASAKD